MVPKAIYTGCIGNSAQLKFDWLFDRAFDNGKIIDATDGLVTFKSMDEGLTDAVKEFVNGGTHLNKLSGNMKHAKIGYATTGHIYLKYREEKIK